MHIAHNNCTKNKSTKAAFKESYAIDYGLELKRIVTKCLNMSDLDTA